MATPWENRGDVLRAANWFVLFCLCGVPIEGGGPAFADDGAATIAVDAGGVPADGAATSAVAVAKAALADAEKRVGPRSPELMAPLVDLARALAEHGDHRGAAEVLRRGTTLTFANDRDGLATRTSLGLAAADQSISSEDCPAAEALLRSLRTDIEATFGATSAEAGMVLHRLGRCAREAGRKDEAEALGRSAHALLTAATDPAYRGEAIEAGIGLATTLYLHDRNAEARDVAEAVMAQARLMPEPDSAVLGAMRKVLDKIGTESAEATRDLAAAREKLAAAEASFGADDPRLAPLLEALAEATDVWAARMNQDAARAEAPAILRRAAGLRWGTSPEEAWQAIRFELLEARRLNRSKRSTEALAVAEAALAHAQSRFGATSPEAGRAEHRIAAILVDLDRDGEAAARFERAAAWVGAANDPDSRRLRVIIGQNRADNLRYLGRKVEALAVAEAAQALSREVEGGDPEVTTGLVKMVAELRRSVLDRRERLAHAQADLEAAETSFGPRDPRLAPLVDAVGDGLELTGDHAGAAAAWARAADLTPGDDEAAVVARSTLRFAAATALRAVDRWDEGLVLLRQQLREVEVRFGATSREAGEIHNRMGVLLADLGRDEESLDAFRTAMRLADTDPNALDVQIVTRGNLSATLFDFGRWADATTIAREGLALIERQEKPDEDRRRTLTARIARAAELAARDAARDARPPNEQRLAAITAAQTELTAAEAAVEAGSPALAAPLTRLAEALEAAERWDGAADVRLRIAGLDWEADPAGAEASAIAYDAAAEDHRRADALAKAILAARASVVAARGVGETSPLLADLENRLGVVLTVADKKDEAIRHFERAIAILGDATDPDRRLRAMRYGFNLADTLSALDRDGEGFEVARRTWIAAADLGEAAKGLRRDLALTIQITARVIANGHFEAGRYEAALEPLRFATEVADIPGMVDPADVYVTFHKLDHAYFRTGRLAEAETAGRRALAGALAGTTDPRRDGRVATAMESLAETLNGLGRNGDAEEFAEQALTIRRAIDPDGEESLRTMVRLSAYIADRAGPTDRALALVRDAVTRHEALHREGRADYHTALAHYSYLLRQAARDAEAVVIDRKVAATSSRISGEASLAHGNDLIGGSYTLANIGRAKEAAAMRRQGLALVRRFAPAGGDHIVNALISTADLGGRDRSDLLWEAMAMVEKWPQDPRGREAEIVRHLAADLIRAGRADDAAALIDRVEAALDRRPEEQRRLRDTDRTRMALLGARVDAAMASRDFVAAEGFGRRRLEMAVALHGADDPVTAGILDTLCFALDGQGRSAESAETHRRALAIRESKLPKDHPDIATSRHNLALVLHRLGQDGEALPLERAAVAATRRADEADHFGLSRMLRSLARIESTLDQNRSALADAGEAVRLAIAGAAIDDDPLGTERARRLNASRDVFVADVDVAWRAAHPAQRPGATGKRPPPPAGRATRAGDKGAPR